LLHEPLDSKIYKEFVLFLPDLCEFKGYLLKCYEIRAIFAVNPQFLLNSLGVNTGFTYYPCLVGFDKRQNRSSKKQRS